MVPAVLAAVAAVASVAQGFMQFGAHRAAGRAAAREGRFLRALAERRAQGLEIAAGQERASAQRSAIEARRQGNFVSGRARALAAASGADPSSPTIVGNLADLGLDADYRVATSLFEGESRGRALEYEAAVERAGGQAALEGSRFQRDLSTERGKMALVGALADAAGSGFKAYQMWPDDGGRASGPAPGSFRAAQEVGMDDTQLSSYGGSPLFTKYGRGGPRYA